jgi:hypothetical protein
MVKPNLATLLFPSRDYRGSLPLLDLLPPGVRVIVFDPKHDSSALRLVERTGDPARDAQLMIAASQVPDLTGKLPPGGTLAGH